MTDNETQDDFMKKARFNNIITLFIAICSITSCDPTRNSEKKEKDLAEIKPAINQNEVMLNKEMSSSSYTVSNELSFLKAYNKKYPYEISLLDKPVIKKRLEVMLGPQYAFIKGIWEVESPITITNGIFFAWGMQAHSGGDPGAVLMADLNKNVLYVGIRKNNDEKFYSEDGSDVPQKMKDWADEQ